MAQFRRTMRWFFGLIGFALGAAVAAAIFFARMMIAPTRQALWASPGDIGLDYEDVQFPAQDGLRVAGWFVPAATDTRRDGATVVLVHGWLWNRLGYAAEDLLANVTGSRGLNFLQLIRVLNTQGYNVLTFDLRNHGQSAASHPVTFGQGEAKDLLGALAYLSTRDDVKKDCLGVIGFSMGANAMLFALPQTGQIRAAVAVQPLSPSLFVSGLARNLLGQAGSIVRTLAEAIYQIFGGPRLAGIQPAFAAGGAGQTPVLYIQGTGDSWGSGDDVSHIASMTPHAQELLFVNSMHRFEGHQYLLDNPKVAIAFFDQHLK